MSAGILAQLIAQGSAGGADLATLRAIAEEAGELGATRTAGWRSFIRCAPNGLPWSWTLADGQRATPIASAGG